MKIGPGFTPIFEHHQKLIFDAKRVGLSSGSPLLAFGGKKQRRHRLERASLDTRKPPERFTFQLFEQLNNYRLTPVGS